MDITEKQTRRTVLFLNIHRIVQVISIQIKQDGKYRSRSLSLVLVLTPNAIGIRRLTIAKINNAIHFVLSSLFLILFLRINPVISIVKKQMVIVTIINNR